MKIYVCKKCGQMVDVIKPACDSLTCCDQLMEELVPASVDAAREKHVPLVNQEGNKVEVRVGEVDHPMTEPHLIEWIAIETNQGMTRKKLTASDQPRAEFLLAEGEELVASYAYCNLHGLWRK